MPTPKAIGIDLGGTKISLVVIDDRGKIYNSSTISTRPDNDIDTFFDRLSDKILELSHQLQDDISGIGIGVPGILDQKHKVVINSVNLKWTNVKFVDALRERLNKDVQIKILGDTLASAIGEYHFGAAQGCNNYIYIAIGTGIGGGIVINGQVLNGASGLAGAVGHYVQDTEGDTCACGLHGCPELLLSGNGLIKRTYHCINEGKTRTSLDGSQPLTTTDIISVAAQNDPLASAVIEEFGTLLGSVLVNCIVVTNPEKIVISGGLGKAIFDIARPYIEKEISHRLLNAFIDPLQVVKSGIESSAIGPACMILFN